jgi:nondiscriminating glutamyl-tRNA synthetase
MIRVRFAPSPTGYLHVGGARTALLNWLFARRHAGVFVLRIEDTDEARSTPESVTAIVDSMRWLGLDWDEGPSESGEGDQGAYGPYFQMRRLELYQRSIARLIDEGKAYPCYCTKEELDEMRRRAQAEKRPLKYDGRCRDLDPARRAALEAQGRKPSVRLRMPESGTSVVEDLIRGAVTFDNSLLQDFVIQKTTGGPTYNFACVVDDHEMAITHVIRADDHLSNTPYQLHLYRAMGWEPPKFAHLSMILGPDGQRLSKRHGATSVGEYCGAGYLPAAMRNFLALLGWSTTDSQQIFEPRELVEKFDLAGCQKSPAVFDPVKLKWMNGEYIRAMPREELLEAARPFLREAGLMDAPRERLLAALALTQEKFKLLSELPEHVGFFFKPAEYRPDAVAKVLKAEGVAAVLDELGAVLRAAQPFAEKVLEERIRAFCSEKGLKTSKVFHPIRVAVSGRTEGPTLFGMLELLGKDEVLRRLADARRLAC